MSTPPIFTVYNSLGKTKQQLLPLQPGKIGIYHCGPTVYWTQHLGNLRAMVLTDFMVRSFEFTGYKVVLVRNYTDVGHLTGDNLGDADAGEDRMTKAAKREQTTPQAIAAKYIKQFDDDVASLNIRQPDHKPKATDFVQHMIDLTQTLLAKGFAYVTDHAIYFDVTKKEDYTKLSGQKLEHQRNDAGHGSVHDSNKKHPQDFALWFFKAGAHANDLQTWPSPFDSPLVSNGQGTPGWHIECSAMSKHFLGETFDVHMGGIEHIPIHHTNEIAQSESAHGKPQAMYWFHNGHLQYEGQKISKSAGHNLVMTDLPQHNLQPLDVRYFFLQAHYRSSQNFTWQAVAAAGTALSRLKTKLHTLPKHGGNVNQQYHAQFTNALLDDFNLPQALAVLQTLLKDTAVNPADVYTTALAFDAVLGLNLHMPYQANAEEIPQHIIDLAKQRNQARQQKDWPAADALRDKLHSLGYEVTDSDEKTLHITKLV